MTWEQRRVRDTMVLRDSNKYQSWVWNCRNMADVGQQMRAHHPCHLWAIKWNLYEAFLPLFSYVIRASNFLEYRIYRQIWPPVSHAAPISQSSVLSPLAPTSPTHSQVRAWVALVSFFVYLVPELVQPVPCREWNGGCGCSWSWLEWDWCGEAEGSEDRGGEEIEGGEMHFWCCLVRGFLMIVVRFSYRFCSIWGSCGVDLYEGKGREDVVEECRGYSYE